MKLIGSTTSPYVRKVRVVMAEKKLDYRFQEESPWSEESKVSASNPLGKVPCLVMEGGEAVFDSRVIVEYLDTLSPVGKLIPTTGRDRWMRACWRAWRRPGRIARIRNVHRRGSIARPARSAPA